MSISEAEIRDATALGVSLTAEALTVDLEDGRTITAPIAWFPRLEYGTPTECANFRLIGDCHGIHWPDLDEDISVASLLAGRRSGESHASLRHWLQLRKRAE